MRTEECKAEFRVGLSDLPLLAESLRIPETFTCPNCNRTVASGMEGLCIALKHIFAYPCRFSDIPDLDVSLITSEVTDFIYATHGHILRDLNQPWLQPHRLTTRRASTCDVQWP